MPGISRTHLTNRSLLRLTGKDVKSFLQNLITNDIEKLSPDNALYSALLTPQGKFLHDFFVIEWEGVIYIDCLNERSVDLVKRLTLYKLRADVAIENVSEKYQIFAHFSQNSEKQVDPPKTQQQSDFLAYIDPRHEGLGIRVISKVGASQKTAVLVETDLTDYARHRLSLGIPEGGSDIIPEKNFLLEVNFEELNGVSFSKGCYVGQELTARTKHRAKIKKRLFQFTYDGEISIGDIISSSGDEIATVCAFEAPYGLAITRLSHWQRALQANTDLEPTGITLDKPKYVILPQ